jgi:hypothetical protein
LDSRCIRKIAAKNVSIQETRDKEKGYRKCIGLIKQGQLVGTVSRNRDGTNPKFGQGFSNREFMLRDRFGEKKTTLKLMQRWENGSERNR